MIELNGSKFALNDNEMMDSLFTPGGTCNGFYKVNKNSVTIFNLQHEKIAVINGHGLLCAATRQKDGKWWYNFATIREIGAYDSYMQSVQEPKAILRRLIAGGVHQI